MDINNLQRTPSYSYRVDVDRIKQRTDCKLGEDPAIGVEHWLTLCYTLARIVRQITDTSPFFESEYQGSFFQKGYPGYF